MTLAAFTTAFSSLRSTSTTGANLVALADLRAAFPQLDRAGFDRALYELRKARAVVLETSESRHGKPSPERLAAAIVEGGRRFVYASMVEAE